MAQLHKVPFEDRRVQSNLVKFVPLSEGEQYVAYYDDTAFDRATTGLVLTTQRLVQVKKGKSSTLALGDIGALVHRRTMGVEYLVVFTEEQELEQNFHDRSTLDCFQAEISKLTGVEPGSEASLVARKLRAAVSNPKVMANLDASGLRRQDERYLAYSDGTVEGATGGLLLTNQRLTCFKKQSTAWSVALGDIESVDFAKKLIWHEFYVYAKGQKHQIDITTAQSAETCQALQFLIAEAQGKEIGGLDGPHVVTGNIVAVPLQEQFFAVEQSAGTAVLNANVKFPPACAWCRSPDVKLSREILLHGKFPIKGSLAKKVGGLVLAHLTLAGGLALYQSGGAKEGDLWVKLLVSACETHRDTPTPPDLQLHTVDWKREVCLLDLKDEQYAREFCRCNSRQSVP